MTDAKAYMRKFVENTSAQKEISDEEISKYKDFGVLVTNYEQTLKSIHKKPLYKSKWGFLIILIIVLLAILISQSVEKDRGDSENDQIENTQ